MGRYKNWISIFLCLFFYSSIGFPGDYESGHGALQVFDAQGSAGAPLWVRIWLKFLVTAFLSSVFFVKSHMEARIALGGFAGVFIMKFLLTNILGMVPLGGLLSLLHVVMWTPVLIVFFRKRYFLRPKNAFSIWSGILTLCILFSFVFDVKDSVIYLMHF